MGPVSAGLQAGTHRFPFSLSNQWGEGGTLEMLPGLVLEGQELEEPTKHKAFLKA